MAPPALDIAASFKSQALRRALWLSGARRDVDSALSERVLGKLSPMKPDRESWHAQPTEKKRSNT